MYDDTSNSSHFLVDDTVQSSFLIQMFLSDLQENGSPAESCPGEGPVTEGEPSAASLVQEEVELESNMFCPGSNVSFSEPFLCVKSHHNSSSNLHTSTTTDSMLNPLDDPFFTNFTDISALEGALLHRNTDPSLSSNFPPNSPALPKTPESVSSYSSVNVQTVLSSIVCENTGVFDLSECVSFLTDTSASTTPLISSPYASSSPSPLSVPSTSANPIQVSTLLEDLDFSTFSGQDFDNVITSIVSMDDPQAQCSSPTSSLSSIVSLNAIQPDLSDSSKKSRKRKSSEATPESLPVRLRRLSSESTSSCSTVADELPFSAVERKKIRREKNNAASVVSRAKRRQRFKDANAREKELETANAELREKVDWLTTETERLRNMLLHKLSQQ